MVGCFWTLVSSQGGVRAFVLAGSSLDMIVVRSSFVNSFAPPEPNALDPSASPTLAALPWRLLLMPPDDRHTERCRHPSPFAYPLGSPPLSPVPLSSSPPTARTVRLPQAAAPNAPMVTVLAASTALSLPAVPTL